MSLNSNRKMTCVGSCIVQHSQIMHSNPASRLQLYYFFFSSFISSWDWPCIIPLLPWGPCIQLSSPLGTGPTYTECPTSKKCFLYSGKCCPFSSVGASRCWPGVSLLILPSISNITCLQHGSESNWFSSLFAADAWPFDLAHWKVIVSHAASVRSLQQWQSSHCSARPNSFLQDRCGGSWGRECDVGRALAELTPGLLTLQNNHAGSHVWRSGVVGSPRYLVLF